jgi:hypothetical protein
MKRGGFPKFGYRKRVLFGAHIILSRSWYVPCLPEAKHVVPVLDNMNP